MSRKILQLGIFVIFAGFVLGVRAQPAKPARGCLKRIGQAEWAILLKDVKAARMKEMVADPDLLKAQAETLRNLLSLSCEAYKLGLVSDPVNAAELANLRSETVASVYDQRFRTDEAYTPFSHVTAPQVAAFYAVPANEKQFENYLATKLAIVRRDIPDQQLSDDEQKAARDLFARVKISEKLALAQGVTFRSMADLKAKIRQVQFTARLAAESVAHELVVGDAQIDRYIATHPEFDPRVKKATAEKLLARAKAGEDFAELADEFTEDPGNGREGIKHGGLYADVEVGVMVPQFEKAALSLEAGEIYPTVVESDFGFHVIKLDKKSADGQKYDVRHILISTTISDPDEPDSQPQPARSVARARLEKEREQKLSERLLAEHHVVVEDYKPVAATPAKRPVRRRRK